MIFIENNNNLLTELRKKSVYLIRFQITERIFPLSGLREHLFRNIVIADVNLFTIRKEHYVFDARFSYQI